jgi:hypothetical protein
MADSSAKYVQKAGFLVGFVCYKGAHFQVCPFVFWVGFKIQ